MTNIFKLTFFILFFTAFSVVFASENVPSKSIENQRVLRTASGGRVKTLDPMLADDLASRNLVGAIFDTLLEYDYNKRPYKLVPSLLEEMPKAENNYKVWHFKLKKDLLFAENICFGKDPKKRVITSKDVLFSILRIAHPKNHSPMYWMYRNKIKGLTSWRKKAANYAKNDFTIYDEDIAGFKIKNDWEFSIYLENPDPRFLYFLAMPNSAIVPKQAVKYYQDNFERNPVGSGPFLLKEWINDYKIILVRNNDTKLEYYPFAENLSDRKKKLPLSDRIEIYLIKQPMTSWLLFLQGKLDFNALDKDNLDLISGTNKLPKALSNRGIKVFTVPEFEIRYVGFNFKDPIFKDNINLRKALSLAYDIQKRVEHANYGLIPAAGPIPPGVAGFNKNLTNPYRGSNIALAKEYLAKANYPNGINKDTKEKLTITFDQTGNSSSYRQLGELAVADFAKINVKVESVLNNNPRFYEKLRRGKMQLFRLSWIGDYPDAENFLQLFYSGNIGGCNRTGYSNKVYDKMFEEIRTMPDSKERTQKYEEMAKFLTNECVWIFEGFPISFQLTHSWLENYIPHDFAFSRYKYLVPNNDKKAKLLKKFKPLSFKELNGR